MMRHAGRLATAWILVAAAAARAAPPAACTFTEDAVAIDGRPNEAAWVKAMPIDGLHDADDRAAGPPRTRLLWDRESLFLAAECDAGGEPDDAVALVLRPSASRPEHYVFRVSADNAVESRLLGDPGAAPGLFWVESAVARRDGGGWSVEMRIPWIALYRTLGRPAVNAAWSFAVARKPAEVGERSAADLSASPPAAGGVVSWPRLDALTPLVFAADPSPRPFGIATRPRPPAHRVQGSPDPPTPFVVEPAFPRAGLKNVIFVCPQPGSDRLLFISDTYGTTPSRIRRIPDRPDASAEEIEVLLDDSHASRRGVVHYAIAFHPRFAENGLVYVGCNGAARKDAATAAERGEPRKTRVLRYRMDPQSPWRLDPTSETEIIAWESDGHNGGALAFGTDGMLYVTSGDGSMDSDAWQTGQDLTRLAAKVLRIDVDRPADGRPYSIPADNPFVGLEGVRPETWAYGLRNPWRIDVDRATGAVWVGNNGQDLVEQVYEIVRGANYGWSAREGSRPFLPEREAGPSRIRPPTCEHDHSEARSLTGGIVCRDVSPRELDGEYVYGDHVTGRIWSVPHDDADAAVPRLLADTQLMITSFARGHSGDLLVTDYYPGKVGGIYRLVSRPAREAVSAFPRRLSETGLFASVPRHEPAPGVIPYDVNSPQWADGAIATRFLVLPETMERHVPGRGWLPGMFPARMRVEPAQGWKLPDGSVTVQSLAIEARPGDPASRRWIETRIMLLNEGDWAGYSYRWRDDQQDADLVPPEGADAGIGPVATEDARTQPWRFPSRAECLVCHSQASNFVLGLSTVQLNRDFDYRAALGGEGAVDNQLRTLEHLGMLEQDVDTPARACIETRIHAEVSVTDRAAALVRACTTSAARAAEPPDVIAPMLFAAPARMPRLVNPRDASQDLAMRVRSYLHANCSSCHINAGGGNSRISLDIDTPSARMQAIDVPPIHATFGIPDPRVVAPAAPDRSILLYRLARRGAAQMPPLCSLSVDAAAVTLVREWIVSLPANASPPTP